MLLRLLSLFVALSPFATPLHGADWWDKMTGLWQGQAKEKPAHQTMRILLMKNLDGIQLEVRGKYRLVNPHTNTYITARPVGKNRFLEAKEDGLKWGESFPGLYQLKIEPIDQSTEILLDNVAYPGNLYFYGVEGKIYVVNEIPIEDYIKVSLSPYTNRQLEHETFAALAIAARTNAYLETLHPKNNFWTVDAQKIGYQGVYPQDQAIEDAVALTRYMVISRTGLYEGVATPFPIEFDELTSGKTKESQVSRISLDEANELAKGGNHAAQILNKAFPGITIMLLEHEKQAE